MIMNRILITLLFASSLTLAACEKKEGPLEHAGRKVDESVEKAKDKAHETAEDIKDGARDAAETVKDAVKPNPTP